MEVFENHREMILDLYDEYKENYEDLRKMFKKPKFNSHGYKPLNYLISQFKRFIPDEIHMIPSYIVNSHLNVYKENTKVYFMEEHGYNNGILLGYTVELRCDSYKAVVQVEDEIRMIDYIWSEYEISSL